jgi:hypothetical protein
MSNNRHFKGIYSGLKVVDQFTLPGKFIVTINDGEDSDYDWNLSYDVLFFVRDEKGGIHPVIIANNELAVVENYRYLEALDESDIASESKRRPGCYRDTIKQEPKYGN